MDDLDAVLTPGEVSAILRVSEVTVRRLIRTGYLPRLAGVRVTLIPRWAVDSYLRGAYHADSDGQGEGRRNDRPDEDAEGCGPLARRRDDARRAARLADGEHDRGLI